MNKEELIEFLRNNLKVDIDSWSKSTDCTYSEGFVVQLFLMGEKISESEVTTKVLP